MVLGDGIRDALRTWGVGRCRRRVAGLDLALLLLCGAVVGGDRKAALLAVYAANVCCTASGAWNMIQRDHAEPLLAL